MTMNRPRLPRRDGPGPRTVALAAIAICAAICGVLVAEDADALPGPPSRGCGAYSTVSR